MSTVSKLQFCELLFLDDAYLLRDERSRELRLSRVCTRKIVVELPLWLCIVIKWPVKNGVLILSIFDTEPSS